jgi:hypothetical protein
MESTKYHQLVHCRSKEVPQVSVGLDDPGWRDSRWESSVPKYGGKMVRGAGVEPTTFGFGDLLEKSIQAYILSISKPGCHSG